MKSFLKDGKDFDFVAPAAISGGTPYLIGAALFGVVMADTVIGDIAVARRVGQFTGLPKAAGVAWVVGDILYWDNTAFNFTKTATANTRVGIAASAQLSADTAGDVLLNGAVG